jgi:cytochrome P450
VTIERDAHPTLEGFDPLSDEFLRDPRATFARAARECPVFHYPPLDLWIVTGYEPLVEVVADHETYSSRALRVVPPPPELAGRIPPNVLDEVFVNLDPPTHTISRRNTNTAFTRGRIARMEGPIRAIAHDQIDRFAGRGRCELMHEFCYPVALRVIVRLLGMPEEDMPRFRQWTEDMFAVMGPGRAGDDENPGPAKPMTEEERRERYSRLVEAHDYYRAYVEERRARPRDDLISALLAATGDDGRPALTTTRIVAHITELVAAGNDTTANLIGHAVLHLSRNPDQLAQVRRDPSLLENTVEEALRMRGTSAGLFRITTRDVELAGVRIPRDSVMWLVFPSAGHDERRFPDAGRFDIHRANAADHLAFGRGRHMCMGAPLARLEARVALEALFEHLPGIHATPGQPLSYLPVMTVVTLDRLEAEWDPAAAAR